MRRMSCVEENFPILKSVVEHAIRSLKKEKSTGLDNIPSNIIINGGSQMVTTSLKLLYSASNYGIRKNGPMPGHGH